MDESQRVWRQLHVLHDAVLALIDLEIDRLNRERRGPDARGRTASIDAVLGSLQSIEFGLREARQQAFAELSRSTESD